MILQLVTRARTARQPNTGGLQECAQFV
jgi:hypothetical protein